MIFKKKKFDLDLDFEIFKKYGQERLLKLKGFNYIRDYPDSIIEGNGVAFKIQNFYGYRYEEEYKRIVEQLTELERLIQLKADIEKIAPKEQTDGKTE